MRAYIIRNGVNINIVLSRIIAALFLGAALSFASVAAWGQSAEQMPVFCGPTALVDANLRDTDYNEVVTFAGTTPGGQGVFIIYSNVKTRTWTLLVTLPTGQSCLIAAGPGYEMDDTDLFPPKKGGT